MYAAAGLSEDTPSTESSSAFDPCHAADIEDQKLSVKLAYALLDAATESASEKLIIDKLSLRIFDGGPAERKAIFDRLLTKGLWVKAGPSHRGHQAYIPVITCTNTLLQVGVLTKAEGTTTFPERLQAQSFLRYFKNSLRKANVQTVVDYYWSARGIELRPKKKGRVASKVAECSHRYEEKSHKFKQQETQCALIASFIEGDSQMSGPDDCPATLAAATDYASELEDRRSRRRPKCHEMHFNSVTTVPHKQIIKKEPIYIYIYI